MSFCPASSILDVPLIPLFIPGKMALLLDSQLFQPFCQREAHDLLAQVHVFCQYLHVSLQEPTKWPYFVNEVSLSGHPKTSQWWSG